MVSLITGLQNAVVYEPYSKLHMYGAGNLSNLECLSRQATSPFGHACQCSAMPALELSVLP